MKLDWRHLGGLLAPAVCRCCGRPLVADERLVCLHCVAAFDVAWPLGDASGPLRERITTRRVDLRAVSAWCYYTHESAVGTLIRAGKYDSRPDIITRLSNLYCDAVQTHPALGDIDVLLPVPMHWLKKLARGYNQAELIARSLGARFDIPVGDNLQARRWRARQATLRGRRRLSGADDAFRLRDPAALAGLHVAIVDDIITSGATVSAAVDAVATASPRAVSVLALAATARK